MSTSKVQKLTLFLLLLSLGVFISVNQSVAETYTLINRSFTLEPSQPEIIGEGDFSLSTQNEYILGIPEELGIGGTSRAPGFTNYFEMWASGRVYVYFLTSTQYLDFLDVWDGTTPPTEYYHRFICDEYVRTEFAGTGVSLFLIAWSDGVDVSGEFFWSEGLNAVIYEPLHIEITESDRSTQDSINVFHTNASVDVFLLSDTQYSTFEDEIGQDEFEDYPLNYLESASGTNIMINYTANANDNTHLLIFHNELYESTAGTLKWDYSYQRTFLENYWSLILVIAFLMILASFFIFQNVLLPPVVWTFTKLRHYLIAIPWNFIKKIAGISWNFIKQKWNQLRGTEEDAEILQEMEDEEEK